MAKIMSINRVRLAENVCSVQKYIFCSMKPKLLLEIDLSGIINCNTFSVVPSIIDKNAKNVLFHFTYFQNKED
jgi:hypothetical protein